MKSVTRFPTVDALVKAYIRPGMALHLAATMARPNALIYALARCFQHTTAGFTISTTAFHSSVHALVIAGVVRRAITCFVGDSYPTPRPNPLYEALSEEHPFQLEQWSLLSFLQRLMAGAMGLPYAVTTSLVGSDLVHGKAGVLFTLPDPDPASAEQNVTLLKPLIPDITLVHGVCADDRGNVVICPPFGEGPWGALAARQGVLASVERIVPRVVIEQQNDRVVIPGHRVLGLCEAPFGAHPQSLRTGGIAGIAGYLDDYEFVTDLAACCQCSTAAHQWYHDWVDLSGGHATYLEQLGPERQNALISGRFHSEPVTPQGDPSAGERLIALAGRAIVERVIAGRYDTILAGIGAAHIAAWVAAVWLHQLNISVRVLAELGFYGVEPCYGDAYLFSQLHAQRAEQLTGIAEILGGLVVGAGSHCLGVLGAAEVDCWGQINTTCSTGGRYLVGSGGANDIAAHTDCIVVAYASRTRFPAKVAFVTSPGRHVREVVCQFGRFQRAHSAEAFRLSSWLPSPADPGLTPAQTVKDATSWPATTEGCTNEDALTWAERTVIWALDPKGFYR